MAEIDFVAWANRGGMISGVDVKGAYLGRPKPPPRILASPRGGIPKAPTRDESLRLLAAIEKYASPATTAPAPEVKAAALLLSPLSAAIEEIRRNGPGDRVSIPEIRPLEGQTNSSAETIVFTPPTRTPVGSASVDETTIRAGDGAVIRFEGNCRFVSDESPRGMAEAHLPTGITGFVFESQAGDPMTFVLLQKHGLVHIGGRGRVVYPDGRTVQAPRE